MKKNYEEPEMEIVEFGSENLMTTSPCNCDMCDVSIGIECVNCVYDE